MRARLGGGMGLAAALIGPRVRRWGFHCPQQGWIDFARFTKPGSVGETGAGCEG